MLLLLLFSQAMSGEVPHSPESGYIHFQSFSDRGWKNNWILTSMINYSGEFKVEDAKEPASYPGERLLVMSSPSSYYGISHRLDKPLVLKDQTLVIQYEVRLQGSLTCGGAYIKLFSTENYDPATLCNETNYSVMFGPDKCGGNNKVHFIFRHKSPKTGLIEEKHLKDPPSVRIDKVNHLYTLIVRSDNTFEILIDAESVKTGNLLNDFEPPVTPPKEVDDPNDVKPSDWVDEEMIDDPEDKKPDDWDETEPEFIQDPEKLEPPEGWLADEPKVIVDPDAQKPSDWDDDIHGEWEPPTIANPKCSVGCGEYEPPLVRNEKYKGKWRPKRIKNPAYKGPWKPRQIPNPNYFEDHHPHNFLPILGLGFELWMVDTDVAFNNVYLGTDEQAVKKWNTKHFLAKTTSQKKSQRKIDRAEAKEDGLISGISESFRDVYDTNPTVFISIVAASVTVPIIVGFILCRRSSTKKEKEKDSGDASDKSGDKESSTKDKEDDNSKSEEGKDDSATTSSDVNKRGSPSTGKGKRSTGDQFD